MQISLKLADSQMTFINAIKMFLSVVSRLTKHEIALEDVVQEMPLCNEYATEVFTPRGFASLAMISTSLAKLASIKGSVDKRTVYKDDSLIFFAVLKLFQIFNFHFG